MNQGGRAVPRRAWFVVAMLAIFMAVNFGDKSVLGLAALPIMAELRLTHEQFGWLGGSFFALFSISAFAFATLGDLTSRRMLLAGMAAVWTIAQLPMIGRIGFGEFVAARVLLGAGEGPAYPVALHEAYTWFPDSRRTTVTAWVQNGVPIGTALATLLLTPVIVAFGWHVAFGVLAVCSALWTAVWIPASRSASPPAREPACDTRRRESRGSWFVGRHLLKPTVIGAMAAIFAGYWVLTISLIWLPPFLETVARLSASQVGAILTAAWAIQVPLYPLTGWISNLLARRGFSPEISRGALGAAGVALSGLSLIGIALTQTIVALCVFVPIAIASVVVIGVTAFPMIAQVVPRRHLGGALGATTAVYALAGVVAPVAVGRIIDAASNSVAGYQWAFATSGAIVAAAALASFALMRPTSDRHAENDLPNLELPIPLTPARGTHGAPAAGPSAR